MNDEYIKKFYNEVCQNLEGNYKIILEPGRKLTDEWIEYDTVKWEIEEELDKLVNKLLEDKNMIIEEQIIKLYEFICLNYIYDANVLYFFRKDASDPNNVKYIAVDWYGRVVGEEWCTKRKQHNRRICYEFSRFYAKAINKLASNNSNNNSHNNSNNNSHIEAFMLGDKENTHYVVGLVSKDYSVILDQDDFNSIKDLTRLKMRLAIKGIRILRDETGKFKQAVDNYNKNRLDELKEIEDAKKEISKSGLIQYFNTVIAIINKYNIDSQGVFEYMRAIVEEQGIEVKKLWKEDVHNIEKRYERCFYFEIDGHTYLLDSIEKTLNIVNLENIDKKLFIFRPEENEYKYYGG